MMLRGNKFWTLLPDMRTGKTMMHRVFAAGGILYAALRRKARIAHSHRSPSLGCLAVVLFAFGASQFAADFASAQHLDTFEGGQPRWLLVESDCAAQVTGQEIGLTMPHSGRTSEIIELACARGTRAIVAYPIEPSLVLNEFRPRLWVRCHSGKMTFGVRVVFPQARHPVTGGRLTTILWGDSYTTPGHWQELRVTELERRLSAEVMRLRKLHSPQLQLDDAHIDTIVLNAYTGPGRYKIQVDDLDLRGLIALSAAGIPTPLNWRRRWKWREEMPSPEQAYWATVNRAPIWLEHRGESFPWIASLGYTGVVMNQLPASQQLADLNHSRLDVICPPPAQAMEFVESDLVAIKGWLVGAAMDGRQIDYARSQARQASQLPAKLARPLVGEALERHWQFARITDELMVAQPNAASAGGWQDRQTWLREKLSVVRPATQGWVSVNVDAGPALIGQAVAVRKALDMDESVNLTTWPMGARHNVISAIVAGARGIMMRSSEPLTATRGQQQAQIAAIRWTNNDLKLWGPWLAQGQALAPPQLNRSDYQAACLSVRDSRLIIAAVSVPESQHVLPATTGQPLQFSIPNAASVQQVFRLTDGKLQPVDADTSGNAITWTIERPRSTESFVVTNSPPVLAYVAKQCEQTVLSNAVDQVDIASESLERATRLIESRYAKAPDERTKMGAARHHLLALAQAQQRINTAQRDLQRNAPSAAINNSADALDLIHGVFFDSYQVARANLAAAQSSPFVLTPSSLHLHWDLAIACERSQWRDVELPGADFADLDRMLAAGWSQQRRQTDQATLAVELVPGSTTQHPRSTNGLRLAAYRQPGSDPISGGYEGALTRVRSAGIELPAGHLVRVVGTAAILKCD
ncbi:MAG TPA: hypothetical protein DDW52_17895, partial [Planctomycetaceae bacterium]|nr:hypothetical protein [Planctomycetaceae bacterium]